MLGVHQHRHARRLHLVDDAAAHALRQDPLGVVRQHDRVDAAEKPAHVVEQTVVNRVRVRGRLLRVQPQNLLLAAQDAEL
jgi:hypothetical protein